MPLSITTQIVAPEGVVGLRTEDGSHLLDDEQAEHTLCNLPRPAGYLVADVQLYGPQVCPGCLAALLEPASPAPAALLDWVRSFDGTLPNLEAPAWDEAPSTRDWRDAVVPPLARVWPSLTARERLLIYAFSAAIVAGWERQA